MAPLPSRLAVFVSVSVAAVSVMAPSVFDPESVSPLPPEIESPAALDRELENVRLPAAVSMASTELAVKFPVPSIAWSVASSNAVPVVRVAPAAIEYRPGVVIPGMAAEFESTSAPAETVVVPA